METNKREIWLKLQRDGLNEFNVLWIQSNGVHFLSDQKIWNCNFSLTCFRCPQETLGRDAAVVREQRRRTLYLSPSPHCNIGVDLPSETPTGSYQLFASSNQNPKIVIVAVREGVKSKPMWLCIFLCTSFEDTYENPQWRKVEQMQPMWLITMAILMQAIWEDILKLTVQES